MAIMKATTKYGVVTGITERNCTSFRGIPFAKAPVGELRFNAPQEPTAWEGERICDTFSPACIQPARGPGGGDGHPEKAQPPQPAPDHRRDRQ